MWTNFFLLARLRFALFESFFLENSLDCEIPVCPGSQGPHQWRPFWRRSVCLPIHITRVFFLVAGQRGFRFKLFSPKCDSAGSHTRGVFIRGDGSILQWRVLVVLFNCELDCYRPFAFLGYLSDGCLFPPSPCNPKMVLGHEWQVFPPKYPILPPPPCP